MGGILATLALFFLTGITIHDHKVVEAEQFVIKDHAGIVRGSFGLIGTTDMPSFTLYDKEANANVLLHLREDGAPGLWLYNKDRIRTSLAVWGDRTLLEIFDKKTTKEWCWEYQIKENQDWNSTAQKASSARC